MFAFSQIIAGGEKVSTITKEMENMGASATKDNDEDEAILAFSNTLPGNEDEPKKVELDEQQMRENMIAEQQLQQLN